MKNKIIAVYSVFIGISVIGLWTLILIKGNIPEGKAELLFHLTSEFLMASICLSSGIMMLRKKPNAEKLNIFGLGMLIYSVLNAAGYYGEKNQTPIMIMFVVLLILTSIALLFQIGSVKRSGMLSDNNHKIN